MTPIEANEPRDAAFADAAAADAAAPPLPPRSLFVSIHGKEGAELDANDADGVQGGQGWREPTQRPTAAPTTAKPSFAPTLYPTAWHGRQPMTIYGYTWYDRNANGVRDSNVGAPGYGDDAEYSHGVGGVSVHLVKCDADTGGAYSPAQVLASATTAGVGQRGEPLVVPLSKDQEGNPVNAYYALRTNEVESYYYVEAIAPPGFLLTSGVCSPDYDDDIESPFHCDYAGAVGEVDRRGLVSAILPIDASTRRRAEDSDSYGVQQGRSQKCIYVDGKGNINENLNFGVMREGDTQEVGAMVALVLEFDETASTGRRLEDVLSRAAVLDSRADEGGAVRTRYLLADNDKLAIGTVTAEVLATTLDARLAEHGVELNSVNPKEVIMSASDSSEGKELAVGMEIKGHYSPPPKIDFDYIVQDSINKDTSTIRRGLSNYNTHCREQMAKVNDEGKREEDFAAVVSQRGAARPGRGGPRPVVDAKSMGDVFSTACSSGSLVPEYFETSLREIAARRVAEVKFSDRDVVYVAEEARGLEPWAMGPVAGIAGLIVLLAGAFVFRRALGPRRADAYSDARKTKDVDGGDEVRRFGESGGAVDDGSVDSAFYSESEDEFEEETEKERKMRRKRKEKEADQGTRLAKSKSVRGKKERGEKSLRRSKKEEDKLAVSPGSDDTLSVGRCSSSSDEVGDLRDRKRASKERKASSKREESPDRKMSSSSKRGRSKRGGGDNARAHGETKLV